MPVSGKKKPKSPFWKEYRELALFLLLMVAFRSAWADWMTVPTGSMNPTILEGDRILVDKHVFGLRIPLTLTRLTPGADPKRGDVVVFDSPTDGTTLVKRVVAIPGDTLELDGETLVLNGQRASYSRGDLRHLRQLLTTTAAQRPMVLIEKEAGVGHEILLLPARVQRQVVGPITVPNGMYFMLGDNRDNSADSRFYGFIPRDEIVGNAKTVVLSLDYDDYYIPRTDRFFRPL